ncbi:MAG: hypothetical protein P4L91_03520 [Burkholderiaceae bacterium]|nr:hypothetical protein [Burkholderiaceae bacterium]
MSLENSQAILTQGRTNMASAMQSFGNDWDQSKQKIAAQRPDLLNQKWDIATSNGKVQVVSSTMSAKDKAWLTGVLNQNTNLVADTQKINTVLVSTFAGTASMAAHDPLGMTLTSLNKNSVDGSVHFLSLLAGVDQEGTTTLTESSGTFESVAVAGSSNIPVAGKISGLNAEANSIPGLQQQSYADTLNVAYIQFLEPKFASTSSTDGTDPLAGQNLDLSNSPGLLSSLNHTGILMSTAPAAGPLVSSYNAAGLSITEAQTSQALGANYRTYGEGLSIENQQSASTTASQNSGSGSASNVTVDANR